MKREKLPSCCKTRQTRTYTVCICFYVIIQSFQVSRAIHSFCQAKLPMVPMCLSAALIFAHLSVCHTDLPHSHASELFSQSLRVWALHGAPVLLLFDWIWMGLRFRIMLFDLQTGPACDQCDRNKWRGPLCEKGLLLTFGGFVNPFQPSAQDV